MAGTFPTGLPDVYRGCFGEHMRPRMSSSAPSPKTFSERILAAYAEYFRRGRRKLHACARARHDQKASLSLAQGLLVESELARREILIGCRLLSSEDFHLRASVLASRSSAA